MAKKIKFESFVYRFLAQAEAMRESLPSVDREIWARFVEKLQFEYSRGNAVVRWTDPRPGSREYHLAAPDLYHRGDTPRHVEEQRAEGLVGGSDPVRRRNADYFSEAVRAVAVEAGLDRLVAGSLHGTADSARLISEERFHDKWAAASEGGDQDVVKANEACTSPEMRYIRSRLGGLRGKKLVDVGCGLGEASVYFALQGADVTSMDLSQGMLDATLRLARRNGVVVRTHKSAAESTRLPEAEVFDVIYAGNLLHHVDIEATLGLLTPHLAPGGMFVSWDPLAYNPAINVYRAIATDVRTPDEHPLRLKDIRLVRREFRQVTTKYFWLSALIIFVLMVLVQRRDPNKERLWKVVVSEGERWRWLYRPLALLDDVLLALVPPLRLLCWNIVFIAQEPVSRAGRRR